MAYWYDGAALAATGSPVIALFWCLIKFTTTTTTNGGQVIAITNLQRGRDRIVLFISFLILTNVL